MKKSEASSVVVGIGTGFVLGYKIEDVKQGIFKGDAKLVTSYVRFVQVVEEIFQLIHDTWSLMVHVPLVDQKRCKYGRP